jgi:hypothetical protein
MASAGCGIVWSRNAAELDRSAGARLAVFAITKEINSTLASDQLHLTGC